LYIIPYTSQDSAVARIRPTEDIRPLADFRANLAAVVRQVQRTKRPVILTQHGRSAAVLVSAAEYEALVDRADLLEDVRVAEAEIEAGQGVAHGRAKAIVLAHLHP
jgi:prevent-host-death family protein